MINKIPAPPLKHGGFFSRLLSAGFAAFGLILIFSVSNVQAATPLAGATIANQASADYMDTGGTLQHTLSNEVTTTVTQVGSYTLAAANTKTAAPGTTVYMPHTLTNTGNGSDSFNITLPATFDSDLSGVAIYADANADGQPDSATPLCTVGGSPACTGTQVQTGVLTAGDKFNFVVAMTVKATATNAATAVETVTAVPVTPALYSTATLSNDDTLTVANNIPVFAVNKSIISSLITGPSGTQVKYKIAYTNSGNAAGPLYIKDLIGSGNAASYSYVTGATWSSSGATVLTDLADTGVDPAGIVYQAITTGSAPNALTTIEALITNVPANTSGFITLTVVVDTGAPLGTSETTNAATYARANNGTADCTGLPCTPAPGTISTTNQSPFTVVGSYGVVANNSASSSSDGDNTTAAGNDLVRVTTDAAPGAVVSFSNEIWNTGSAPDTFNITTGDVSAGTAFPAGTTFQLFKSDGSTPLVSSDADGIPDTGPVSTGERYTVVLKAIIPANACSLIDCTTASNFTVSKTATSKGNPAVKNTVFDQLAAITPSSVDLTNNLGVDGTGAGNTTTVITPKTVAPGNVAQFDLSVKNTGTANDNYNLSYHLTAGSALVDATAFVPGTLLSGWTVAIHAGACSGTLGAVVSNTGTILPGTRLDFCAVVTTPATGATASAGTYNAYFKVTSGATGATDIKLDSVTLSPLNNLVLLTAGAGQIQPGGIVVYSHTLANGGNNSCGGDFTFNVTNNKAADGWSYVLYLDNGTTPGSVDATDTPLGGGVADSSITTTMPALSAGTNVKLLVKVQAPPSATLGTADVITVIATDTVLSCGTTAPITDTTNVVAGQISLVKTQALSAWNSSSSTCDVAGAYSISAQSQKPGDCVWYKIVATNNGDADVTDVVINDTTPTFTTYGGGGACSSGATLTAPAVSSTGVVKCATWATVAPAASTQLEFSVRINP